MYAIVAESGGVNMDEKTYKSLFVELESYEQLGIRMRIDEEPASPMQIVTAHMLKEENNYMRDYVWDERGKIRELVFHNIKSK